MAEFMRRFATGLDTYEFAEVRSEDAADFEEAVAFMLDHVGGGAAVSKATETVKKTFGNTTPVSTSGTGGFKGRQAQQSEPDEVELGEHDGYKIYAKKSKFGGIYYSAFKAGADRINSKSIKGATVSQATLEKAIDMISEAAQQAA